MADAHDGDRPVIVLNRIEDTIVALTHAIQVISREFLGTRRSWIGRESLNSSGEAALVALGKRPELANGRGLDP